LLSFSTEKNTAGMPLEYLVDQSSIDGTSADLAGWPQPLLRLREALEKNEFALYCQPMVALTGGERYPMAEVLVRMREEERSLLPPGEFLPVFEHYAMMPQLDRWVLRHTVQQLARGSRIPRFTINVSGQTLRDAAFPAFAAAELRAARIAMDAVMFEIDESDVLARPEAAAGFASAVRAYGGGVLIDGFCRRAVSFAPFKDLRPHFVKVDGSVTRKLLANEVAQTKVKAVVRVADALGIGVVAECVEEQDLLARLKALDVGFAQGFGVYQPQPIERVAAAIKP
jgi:EAL domain-containing protein (putative c-di-GMP-specific phosphodiesterase class I)